MGRGSGLSWLPKTLSRTLFLYLSLATVIVSIHGQSQNCTPNDLPPSSATQNVTVDQCQIIDVSPATFTLWYQQNTSTSPTTLSVILSVPNQARWYGMGFNSQQDSMPGTSAIIFWLNQTSQVPIVNTYFLSYEDASGVNVDNTTLTYKVAPSVVADSSNLYLAFEVEETQESDFAFQNFAVGQPGDIPSGSVIGPNQQQHQGEVSIQIDFVSG